jgi:hemerythrin superfamily protein
MAHCHAVQDTAAAHESRERSRHLLVHDLSVHSLSEEEVLYPALRRVMGKEIR